MIVSFTAQDIPVDLPSHVVTGLYRIVQEALRNVSKHAGRTHVKIAVSSHADGIRLHVVDYGVGFDIQAGRRGLGLISMEERARMMEGVLNVESQLGNGTRITVDVPLPPSNQA